MLGRLGDNCRNNRVVCTKKSRNTNWWDACG
nr:MAG TPA: hypothetical protein [Caudoviricetes sp.]